MYSVKIIESKDSQIFSMKSHQSKQNHLAKRNIDPRHLSIHDMYTSDYCIDKVSRCTELIYKLYRYTSLIYKYYHTTQLTKKNIVSRHLYIITSLKHNNL